MTHLKPPTTSRRAIAAVFLLFFAVVLGVTGTFSMLPSVQKAEAATTNDCSDVYTSLDSYILDDVAANKSFYTKAMNATGVPWELLAAIHYRETNFSHTEPGNGQGIFQDGYTVASPGTTLNDTQFYQEVLQVAKLIQNTYALRNSPNPATNVTPRALTASEQDINLVKNTLYSYNGRSSAYAQQAATYGYDSSTVPYEGSPYVMNRFDCPRARMGIITQDYGTIDGTDTRYGAFTLYARLHSDSYWLAMTVPYSWIINSQEMYVDPNRTVKANPGLLAANTTYYLRVTARNFGNTTWTNTGSYPIKLGTNDPRDRNSIFCDSSWISCNRPALLTESSVAPGEIGTFDFSIKTPATYGTYNEHFNLLAEHKTWMNDPGLNYSLTIKPPTYQWQLQSQAAYVDASHTQSFSGTTVHLAPGGKAYIEITALNTGNTTWIPSFAHLGTVDPQDRKSLFYDASWLNYTRPAQISESSVPPGETGTFDFTITAPFTLGNYDEHFNMVAEHITWMPSQQLHFFIDVSNPLTAQATRYQLSPGDTMSVNSLLLSQDTKRALILQSDGNLVLYNDYSPAWSTGTSGSGAQTFYMQTDGNLVLRNSAGVALWNSHTAGNAGAYLVLRTDGNLVLYNSTSTILWSTGTASVPDGLSYMDSRTSYRANIFTGQSLQTANCYYTAALQSDGNFVLRNQFGVAVWDSRTWGHPGDSLTLQRDGNLVIYDKDNKPLWSTGTHGSVINRLELGDDGNLGLYNGNGQVIWQTNTPQALSAATITNSVTSGQKLASGSIVHSTDDNFTLTMQTDGNLVLRNKDNVALWNSHTAGNAGADLTAQQDGNIVLRRADGATLWNSHTAGNAGAYILLDNGGTLKVYDVYSRLLWSSS